MNKIEKWKKSKKDLNLARAYLGLLGKTTNSSTVAHRHGEGATAGKLTTFEVKTQINFQPHDGATNYHNCSAFDVAITQAARENFSGLMGRAVEILEDMARHDGLEAKSDLQALLDEVSA